MSSHTSEPLASARPLTLTDDIPQLPVQVSNFPALDDVESGQPIAYPRPFTGRREDILEFLSKCRLVFSDVQPRTYATDAARIGFATLLLRGRAYDWVRPYINLKIEERPVWLRDWAAFQKELKDQFGYHKIAETARRTLRTLKQTGTAQPYAIEFRWHLQYVNWDDETIKGFFFDGLKIDVKLRLLSPSRFPDFESLITAAFKYDGLLEQFRTKDDSRTPSSNHSTMTTPRRSATHAPMDTSASQAHQPHERLRPEEREYRMKNNLCYYCGKPGHKVFECRAAKYSREQQGWTKIS